MAKIPTKHNLQAKSPTYSLSNPFATPDLKPNEAASQGMEKRIHPAYAQTLDRAKVLRQRATHMGGPARVYQQHGKGRMTIQERLAFLCNGQIQTLFDNWGAHLDGDSLLTAIGQIDGRDVAVYGHDFTQRAGSINAGNGRKLARLLELAQQNAIPVIGMNDSAGAFVPAGVGGLDGYAQAFSAMRKLSGVCPSIMLMFGYNAGGGAYLPRQGSYVIQPQKAFFGLTGPEVVRSSLGEDVSADDLGGPKVHTASGVADLAAQNETHALQLTKELLTYLPSNNHSLAPYLPSTDPVGVFNEEESLLLQRVLGESTSGFNTPFDITLWLQCVLDHASYFELQPQRARNIITAYARINGWVVGVVANNSAVDSGYINVHAARKATRFIRFCNLYNIPLLFVEDVTGFAPGSEQEKAGIVQAGRELLDAIIDVRTPRLTVIVRNAYGGAYASYNNYSTGADAVFALPTARIAVMGPAGVPFVYKSEHRQLLQTFAQARAAAKNDPSAQQQALEARNQALADLTQRYEQELMTPEEALKLGSVGKLLQPGESRQAIAQFLSFRMRHYTPCAMPGPVKE